MADIADATYPVTFYVAGLPPGGNVVIRLNPRSQDTFTLGPPDANAGNGLAVLGGPAFSEIAFSPTEISISGSTAPSGGAASAAPMITIRTWIKTQGPTVIGSVTLPGGATLKVDAPRGESGTQTTSGDWIAKVS